MIFFFQKKTQHKLTQSEMIASNYLFVSLTQNEWRESNRYKAQMNAKEWNEGIAMHEAWHGGVWLNAKNECMNNPL